VTCVHTILFPAYVDEFRGVSANRDNILSMMTPGTEVNRWYSFSFSVLECRACLSANIAEI
jgi:hypothetical protein